MSKRRIKDPAYAAEIAERRTMCLRDRRIFNLCLLLLVTLFYAAGCAHYPINQPLKKEDIQRDYKGMYMGIPGNSENVVLELSFSGGGTRAAALSYGVLEKLRETEVTIDGKKRSLLYEIDGISSVSGGSFTAGYFGLFGDQIFSDFEGKFLKKNIQGALAARIFLNPINWVRLISPYFDRSDLATEYYDKHVFEGGTIGDIGARKGPRILMNATEMTYGIRIGFTQEVFDTICSDLSPFPVARAASASSAVPMLLSPITLRNYAGTCGFKIPEKFEEIIKGHTVSERQFYLANNVAPLFDSQKNPYIHLVDGGVADNLGLRAVLDRVVVRGSVWEYIKGTPKENVNKIVFIIVNAETAPDTKWSTRERTPPFSAMMSSYSSIGIERYNEETIALLKDSVKLWADEIKTQRCRGGAVSTAPGSCGDIKFYVVEVKFANLEDQKEQMYFKKLPTSFKLKPEQVDKLREVAHRIMNDSPEFQRVLNDLR